MSNFLKHAEHYQAMAAYTDWRIEKFKMCTGYENEPTYHDMCFESRMWKRLATIRLADAVVA